MATRLTIEQVREYVGQRRYTLLSKEYKNNRTKLSMECNKGHQYEVTWSDFQQGYRCPFCSKKRVTYQQVKQHIEQQNYILLSQRYKNTHTKLDIQCDEEHKYRTTWANFQTGYRCPKCARIKVAAKQRLSFEQVKKYIKEQGHALLSKEYRNNSTKLKIQCPKNHLFWMCWNDFQTGYRCSTCNESKGERIVANILDDLSIAYIRQYKLQKGKNSLKLDFFIPSLSLGIEYDGEHHFRPIQYGGMSLKRAEKQFELQQERDRRKDGLCEERGYKLIRIAYNEDLTLEAVESKIQECTAFATA